MTDYAKGNLLAEGKTKKIWEIIGGNNGLVIIENKPDITAFDDPTFTKRVESKAAYAPSTTCRVFELLKRTGIPVAYIEQISATEFVAKKCSMIPLEAVARRFAVGSYLKRNPNFEQPKGKPPARFHRLKTEFFLKTTKGTLHTASGAIVEGLDREKGEEDPFILNPYNDSWDIYHSKKPIWDPAAKLREGISAPRIMQSLNIKNTIKEIEGLLRDTFLVLEGMWASFGFHFIDLKIELGLDMTVIGGPLTVADVIDNDSWRLQDQNWQELSKEAFRQGEKLDEVEKKYGIVANLLIGFRIPRQCLVLWRGSESDEFPKLSQSLNLRSISIESITASGHKAPQRCLDILNELEGKYPDGGIIVAKVGMSNGLGPMLAARTSWPVISIPATLNEHPEDIWSNTRIPSHVPMAVIASEGNATDFALKILAQKNPFLYWQLQKRIEELDE